MTTAPPPSQYAIGLCSVLWVASYTVPVYLLPITVFVSLLLAVLVWGIALSGAGESTSHADLSGVRLAWLPCGALVAICLLAAVQRAWVDALVLLAAAAVLLFGSTEQDARWLRALWWALVVAACVNVMVGAVQLVFPAGDFPGIAPSHTPGRAAANLRQPNLFSQLILLGLVALMGLQRLSSQAVRTLSIGIALLLGMGLAFSQSRTGLLGLALLLGWGLFDRRMPWTHRLLPWAALVGYLLGLALVWLNAEFRGGVPYFVYREAVSSDISTSRFAIWANTLSLIAGNPFFGVGWGRFAQAWALTPFPNRPLSSFDNAHNLPLQLVVELGFPIALAAMGALAWSLWRGRRAVTYALSGEQAIDARCLLASLALLGVHSLLEYPLWYTYFLLPAAFLFGQYLRMGGVAEHAAAVDTPSVARNNNSAKTRAVPILLKLCGVLIVLGSLYAAWDYARVLQAFKPFGAGLRQSLEQRVAEGRKSALFGYWVDFGVVTNLDTYAGRSEEVERAFRYRVNPHMLMIYAKYLHERGEDDKASYVAARLREFHNAVSDAFFAECDAVPAGRPKPFQCVPPSRIYGLREFADSH
jgi:O-antigen ligase